MSCEKLFKSEIEIIQGMVEEMMQKHGMSDMKMIEHMVEENIRSHMDSFEQLAFKRCMDRKSAECRRCFAGHMQSDIDN